MRSLCVIAALLWTVTAAFAGEPVGSYRVEGTNPDGRSKYTGTVNVEKTGETFRVTWVVGGTRYVGTAVRNEGFIAVSYRSADSTGVALYAPDGDDWKGTWTSTGGHEAGSERWTRR
jgi:hypothetical protein